MKRLRTKERGSNEPPCPAGHLAAMVLSSTPVQISHIALVLKHQDKPGCPLVIVHADQPLQRHHAKRSITSSRASPLAKHRALLGRYTSPCPTRGPTGNVREHAPGQSNVKHISSTCHLHACKQHEMARVPPHMENGEAQEEHGR